MRSLGDSFVHYFDWVKSLETAARHGLPIIGPYNDVRFTVLRVTMVTIGRLIEAFVPRAYSPRIGDRMCCMSSADFHCRPVVAAMASKHIYLDNGPRSYGSFLAETSTFTVSSTILTWPATTFRCSSQNRVIFISVNLTRDQFSLLPAPCRSKTWSKMGRLSI